MDEILKDERGSTSVSRLGPMAWLAITVLASSVGLYQTGKLPVFDNSWLVLGGTLLTAYAAAKKLTSDHVEALAPAVPPEAK